MQFKKLLLTRFPGHPVFLAEYNPVDVVLYEDSGASGRQMPLDSIVNVPLFGFAGIAYPERFAGTLAGLGCTVTDFMSLPDHHEYAPGNLLDLFGRAARSGATACITSEKDMAKLQGRQLSMPVYVLRMQVEFADDFDTFLEIFPA